MAKLTGNDLIFVQRMLPHMLAGLSLEAAGRAVLADDQRIADAMFIGNRRNDENDIRSELSAAVYHACRAKAA